MKVFLASTLSMAEEWKRLRQFWLPEVQITSRWIDFPDIVNGDDHATPLQYSKGWIEAEQDIANSDTLICYGERDHLLRGALIETGIALALRVPVLLVGDCPSFGTWRHHPKIHQCLTMIGAKALLETWRRGAQGGLSI